ADEACIAIAAQSIADQVRRQRSLIDATIHELIRSNEGPRTEIDFAGTNAARPSPTDIEPGARIRPVRPVVVWAIAVVPTHRRPAYVARAVHPVDPRGRVRGAGQPHPAVRRFIRPAAIVIRPPTPRIVRNP